MMLGQNFILQVIKEKQITAILGSKQEVAKATVIGRDCPSTTTHVLRTIERIHLRITIVVYISIYFAKYLHTRPVLAH